MQNYTTGESILQQSQAKLVFEYLQAHGITPTPQELWHMTEIFVQCCTHPRDKELNKRLKDMNNWIITQKQKWINTEK